MSESIKKSPDLSALLKKEHTNKWVALSSDYSKIVAVGDSLLDLSNQVRDSSVVVMKVLPHVTEYAP